jgi:hypothetical protein
MAVPTHLRDKQREPQADADDGSAQRDDERELCPVLLQAHALRTNKSRAQGSGSMRTECTASGTVNLSRGQPPDLRVPVHAAPSLFELLGATHVGHIDAIGHAAVQHKHGRRHANVRAHEQQLGHVKSAEMPFPARRAHAISVDEPEEEEAAREEDLAKDLDARVATHANAVGRSADWRRTLEREGGRNGLPASTRK